MQFFSTAHARIRNRQADRLDPDARLQFIRSSKSSKSKRSIADHADSGQLTVKLDNMCLIFIAVIHIMERRALYTVRTLSIGAIKYGTTRFVWIFIYPF